MRHPIFSALAIGWLLFLSGFEIFHFVRGEPWPGYTPVVNYVSFIYVVIYLIGCAYLARYQMGRPIVPMIAFAAAIVQGALIRVGGGWQGYVEFGSGVALMLLGFFTLNYRVVHDTRRIDLSQRKAA